MNSVATAIGAAATFLGADLHAGTPLAVRRRRHRRRRDHFHRRDPGGSGAAAVGAVPARTCSGPTTRRARDPRFGGLRGGHRLAARRAHGAGGADRRARRCPGWPRTAWCSASTPCWCWSSCGTPTPRTSRASAPRRCSSRATRRRVVPGDGSSRRPPSTRWGRYAHGQRRAAARGAVIQLGGVGLQLPMMLVCGFLLGAAGQVVKLCADSAMQIDVDDALRGHVFTVQDSLFWVSFVVAIDGGGRRHPRRRPLARAGRRRRRRSTWSGSRCTPPSAAARGRRRAKVCRMADSGPDRGRSSRRERRTRRARRRPARRRTGPTPHRRRAGPSPTRSRTCCGPTGSPLSSVTDEAGFAEVLDAAAGEPERLRRRGRRGTRRRRRLPSCWPTGGPPGTRLHDELLTVADGRKLPWFGPPMSAASMATARLMETWAHGLDVADALGVKRPATARLRSIAHIGVRTRDFAFAVNGLTAPGGSVPRRAARARRRRRGRGVPADAAQRVTGSAEDFCMLVTQRRPRAELDVAADGDDAQRWLTIAQAFAGPPGPGRELDRYSSLAASARAVAVGVGQLDVPPPVTVGVDVRRSRRSSTRSASPSPSASTSRSSACPSPSKSTSRAARCARRRRGRTSAAARPRSDRRPPTCPSRRR